MGEPGWEFAVRQVVALGRAAVWPGALVFLLTRHVPGESRSVLHVLLRKLESLVHLRAAGYEVTFLPDLPAPLETFHPVSSTQPTDDL